MRYQVTGKQIDIGEALTSYVESELTEVIGKYSDRPTDAQIIFSKSANEFVCETIVHLSTGLTAQARNHSHDIYASFDGARDKMDKQLRRYKRRLKDHHKDRVNPVAVSGAGSYILAANEDSEEVEPESLNPVIVAEMETNIPVLSAGEAVMQMELAHLPVQIFRNEKNNRLNVVYRREDGNIGWIDPRE